MSSDELSTQAARFWQRYLDSLPADVPRPAAPYAAWSFGDSPVMADELLALVRRGTKTATASLLWAYEAAGEPLPAPGSRSIVLDGADAPGCIIETTEVLVLPFNVVDQRFAADEGEGDYSLAAWRAAHWSFFGRQCAEIGRVPDETMPVVCERFRLVYG